MRASRTATLAQGVLLSALPRLRERIRRHPDYVGAVLTGYGLVALNILVQVLLVPLYLRTLGKYEFGVLMVLLSFINYSAIGITWMAGGMARALGEYAAQRDDDGFARAYALSKVVYVAYALLLAVPIVALGIHPASPLFGSVPAAHLREVRLAVLAAALYFVVHYDFSVERLAFTALQRQLAGNVLQGISLAVFVASVVPWLLGGGGLEGVLVCLLAGVVTARAASWIYWRRVGMRVRWRLPDRESLPLLRRLVGRVGIAYVAYGIVLLTLQADTLIVGWMVGVEAAAEFVLIWKIAEVLVQIIWRIPEYLQPYIVQMDARGETERIESLYKDAMRWLQVLSLLAAVGYAVLGPWVVRLWVGEANAPQSELGYVLAGAAVFWLASARLPAIIAFSTVRLGSLIRVSAAELAGKLLLTVLLFPRLGYVAPLLAVNLVHAGGIAWAYRRLVHARRTVPELLTQTTT